MYSMKLGSVNVVAPSSYHFQLACVNVYDSLARIGMYEESRGLEIRNWRFCDMARWNSGSAKDKMRSCCKAAKRKRRRDEHINERRPLETTTILLLCCHLQIEYCNLNTRAKLQNGSNY
jgi:hypothetical protein